MDKNSETPLAEAIAWLLYNKFGINSKVHQVEWVVTKITIMLWPSLPSDVAVTQASWLMIY